MGKKVWHFITVDPAMKFGQPCVDHHRITANQMADVWYFNGEMDLAGIEENWPGMNRGAVLVACWYVARYGTPMRRKPWKEWVEKAEGLLWKGDYKHCPMPPRREEVKS